MRGVFRFETAMDVIYGIHSVLECLKSNVRPVERIFFSQGAGGRALQEVVELARHRGLPLKFEPRAALDRRTGNAAHQGVVAICGARQYVDLEDLLASSSASALLVILDSIVDPRNLGAILRSCAAYGVDGVVIPKDNAAGLSSAALKTAEGAAEHIRTARVTNLSRSILQIKEHGFWVVGIESGQKTFCDEVDYGAATALVLGNEGTGLRRLTRESCDILASIPTPGKLHSLNVSVSAGIAMYEVVRSRRAKLAGGRERP